jgi:hypothetical protein
MLSVARFLFLVLVTLQGREQTWGGKLSHRTEILHLAVALRLPQATAEPLFRWTKAG